MTTIVGIQGHNYAVIGSDSRIVQTDDNSWGQISTLSTNHSKVARIRQYLIGVAGDVRAINLLHYGWTPPKANPRHTRRELDTFVTREVIPGIREVFDNHGYSTKTDETGATQNSMIMLAINNTIYVIDSSYAWATDNLGLYAIGTGAPYALGALNTLPPAQTPKQAQQHAKTALTIASKYDPHTGPPHKTHTQQNQPEQKN